MRATLSNFEKYDKATYFAPYYVTYETYNIFAQNENSISHATGRRSIEVKWF